MKLGTDVLQGMVLMDLAPLSPRAGAAVSKVGWKGAALSRKECEHGLSCTAARACLETSYTGTHYAWKNVSKINKAADRCSTLRNEGTDCTELRAVAPKKKPLCNVAIRQTTRKQIAGGLLEP
jgi:hypothetical protein